MGLKLAEIISTKLLEKVGDKYRVDISIWKKIENKVNASKFYWFHLIFHI